MNKHFIDAYLPIDDYIYVNVYNFVYMHDIVQCLCKLDCSVSDCITLRYI